MSTLFNNAMTYTENGALTYSTSGDAVLNLFSMGGSLRNRDESEVVDLVNKAFSENPIQTIETLLYLRDIRGGQGERRVFYISINAIRKNFNMEELIKAIVEVGSWKDVFTMFQVGEYVPYIKPIILKHIEEDKYDLLEKWLPSVGGSKNKDAETIAKYVGMTPKQYRKYLSKARKSLDVVETHMCDNTWEDINYEHVPSRAGLIHGPAFMRHDGDRRREYLYATMNKERTVNMNTGTLYPYEITGKYINGFSEEQDLLLEATWKNLPNYCDGKNALVVADTSGSMWGMPMNVATSLAIYFAEHNKGIFHNEYITFSSRPKFITFKDSDSLLDKVRTMRDNSIVENTNLQGVFDLVLSTATRNNIPQEEMPEVIYVISDMEFDCATFSYDIPKTNFEVVKEKYEEAGYKMPTLVFWNVDSRQNNLPVSKNEKGVVLVSGSSASTFQMVISNDMNPYNFMIETITKERYKTLAEKIFN